MAAVTRAYALRGSASGGRQLCQQLFQDAVEQVGVPAEAG